LYVQSSRLHCSIAETSIWLVFCILLLWNNCNNLSVGDVNAELQDSDRASERPDPMRFCSHIQGQIKKTKHRVAQQKIEETMTHEERSKERDIQRQQLEEIFRIMEEHKEKFGVSDVSDVQEQLKMYIQWIQYIQFRVGSFLAK